MSALWGLAGASVIAGLIVGGGLGLLLVVVGVLIIGSSLL
jgi:hypothetical protein